MSRRTACVAAVVAIVFAAGLSAKDGDKKKGPIPGTDAFILDLAGDGIDLTSTAQTKLVGGKAQKLHWTKKDGDDAFVVLDCAALVKAKFTVAGAGGGKLTGNVLLDGNVRVKAKRDEGASNVQSSGGVWLALRDLDTNRDGKVDASDPTWAHMKAWVDKDANGAIAPGELKGIEDAGVKSISLPTADPESLAKPDADGSVRVDGEYLRADGKTGLASAVTLAAAK